MTNAEESALVSVVIPAFNAASTIERTLASVAAQSYRNFEAIVVDDGSTDQTPEIVRRFAAVDGRFRLIQKANGGVASARNAGLHAARGAYVAPVDADDIWHQDNLAKQVAALERSGPTVSFSFARSFTIDEHDRRRRGTTHPLPADYISLLRRNWVGNGSAAVFRRDPLLAIGGYDETLRTRGAQGAEDWKVILKLAAQGPGVSLSEELIGYRQMAESMSGNPATMSRSALLVIEEMRRSGPKIAPWHFWQARTSIHTWMFYPWIYAGRWREALGCLARAYILNPLWFMEKEPRDFLFRGLIPHVIIHVGRRLGLVRSQRDSTVSK